MGLRDLRLDPNLLLYVPAAVARTTEVAPLGLEENVLRLACAAPDADLEPIRARFPRLALDVCLSGSEEIRRVLTNMGEAAA